MPSVKPRGAKGGHGAASPSDKGSSQPSGGAGDVAKKPSQPALYLQQQQQPPPPPPLRAHEQSMPPQPQQQAHGKGGHRGKAAANAAASSEPCSRWRGHSAESFLFYLALVVATGLSGWYARRFLDEVQQVRLSHQDLNQQNDVLVQGLQGVEQKVHSLQTILGAFESTLRSSQQKQDLTEKAVKQGEGEINRISEVLQKLQNEILKDLSDGIHVVKDTHEQDFMSLEKTVEERLTELTNSINDNIALFTDVQKSSQKEINEVKAKVARLGVLEGTPRELQGLQEAVQVLQAAGKPQDGELKALQQTLSTLEAEVNSQVKELVNLKQEQKGFWEEAEVQRLALRTLEEKLAEAKQASDHFSAQLQRLEEELHQMRADVREPQSPEAWEVLQKESRELDSRLQSVESGVQVAQAVAARQAQTLETLVSNSEEQEQRLADLQKHLENLDSSSDAEVEAGTLANTVQNLGEAQVALYSDVEEMKKSMGELPSMVGTLQRMQEQVNTLLHTDPAPPQDLLDRLASLDSLKATINQMESDLKTLNSDVDSLVEYSEKIEINENKLDSVKDLVENLRNDLDKLFLRVEKIHENV